MGVEFLLVLGLIVIVAAAAPAMAHADDDRPDPEKIKEATVAATELNAAKREGQGLDQRAVEQSARLTRDTRERATAEKQIAEHRAAANTQLDEALNKGVALGEQMAELGKQKAVSFTATPKLDTTDLTKSTYEAVKGALERAATDGGSFLSDHWGKILGTIGAGALALKGRKALKVRKTPL